MRRLLLSMLLINIFGSINAQQMTFPLLNVSDIEYSDYEGNRVIPSNEPFGRLDIKYYQQKITSKEVEMIGDTTGYRIKLHESVFYKNQSSRSKLLGSGRSSYIYLIGEEADMFRKIVLKYFEWYEKAKKEKIALLKEMYSSLNNENLGYKDEYGRFKIADNSLNVKYTATYDNDDLKFRLTISGKDKSLYIVLNNKDLELIKTLIDNGKYDKYISKCKEVNKTWDEFESF